MWQTKKHIINFPFLFALNRKKFIFTVWMRKDRKSFWELACNAIIIWRWSVKWILHSRLFSSSSSYISHKKVSTTNWKLHSTVWFASHDIHNIIVMWISFIMNMNWDGYYVIYLKMKRVAWSFFWFSFIWFSKLDILFFSGSVVKCYIISNLDVIKVNIVDMEKCERLAV
jgi:hypothetical protein